MEGSTPTVSVAVDVAAAVAAAAVVATTTAAAATTVVLLQLLPALVLYIKGSLPRNGNPTVVLLFSLLC